MTASTRNRRYNGSFTARPKISRRKPRGCDASPRRFTAGGNADRIRLCGTFDNSNKKCDLGVARILTSLIQGLLKFPRILSEMSTHFRIKISDQSKSVCLENHITVILNDRQYKYSCQPESKIIFNPFSYFLKRDYLGYTSAMNLYSINLYDFCENIFQIIVDAVCSFYCCRH